MKVKELIEKLSKLDQGRDIWIGYDYPYSCNEPEFIEVDAEDAYVFDGCEPGDYAHYAG